MNGQGEDRINRINGIGGGGGGDRINRIDRIGGGGEEVLVRGGF